MFWQLDFEKVQMPKSGFDQSGLQNNSTDYLTNTKKDEKLSRFQKSQELKVALQGRIQACFGTAGAVWAPKKIRPKIFFTMIISNTFVYFS